MMLLKKRFFLPLALLITCQAYSQTAFNLGPPVNSLLTSEYAPSLTGNGRTMIFTATTGEDNRPELLISHAKSSIWSRPEPVPHFTSVTGKIALPKDPVLSYDGKTIYFSASKYGGVGGTDIWYMEKTGNIWSLPKNIAKPVNSEGHESDPSISPDGKFLYFVRYSDKKSPTGQPCGKIFVSEKTGNIWKEAKALPAPVNMGCECNPRILADNETLLFASVRPGGKGGFDQYKTQLQSNGSWSTPVPMAFINTDKDDQYVSVPAMGNFIYHAGPSKSGTDIFKTIIPEELRQKNVIAIEGYVKDKQTQKPLSARIVVYDTKKNTIANLIHTDAAGAYLIYLTEGTTYDLSVVSNNNKTYEYYSEFIDLDTLSKYKELRKDVNLSPLRKDLTIQAANVAFQEGTDKILDRSGFELGRIQRMLQDNPGATIEIGVHMDKVMMDSVSSPLLSEIITDSIEVADPEDTTGIGKIKIARHTYHNDITQKQADAIVNALIKKGVAPQRVSGKGYGDKHPLVPHDAPNSAIMNKRVEIKITKQ